MAYDSKTYGQSPFGNSSKPDTPKSDASKSPADDGLDQGPAKAGSPGLASKFPTISTTAKTVSVGSKLGGSQLSTNSTASSSTSSASSSSSSGKKSSAKRSKSTASKSSTKSSRKSKKAKAAEAAKAEAEAAEAAIARRFLEEDQRAYLSLLQKTVISGLVWAVLRLSVYELPDNAIAIVNIIINPMVIATLSLMTIIGLTFWFRRLLNDLAQHTQQLQADAEAEDLKNSRPTIEIVGDSLEYNPRLRKNFARLFNVASLLICTLTSYLLVIGITLAWEAK
ncbi:MAG: hypothetical protein AAGC93_14430 [Cyanobacteria bacterium P01_F01_bin.53]